MKVLFSKDATLRPSATSNVTTPDTHVRAPPIATVVECSWEGLRPVLAYAWAAKCSVSCQRGRRDERSHVNCLGYNIISPRQLGLTSCQATREQAMGLTLVWLCGAIKDQISPVISSSLTRTAYHVWGIGCLMLSLCDWKGGYYPRDSLSALARLRWNYITSRETG